MGYMFNRVAFRSVFVGVIVSGLLGVPSDVLGQPQVDELQDVNHGGYDLLQEEDPYQPNVGKIYFGAGVDMTNAYFFRGVLQEDQSFIAQPWIEMTMDLYDGSGVINDFTLTLGMWNSVHDNNTASSRGPGNIQQWYETDLYLTMSLGIADNLGVGFTYIAYTSPSNAFQTIHEIMLAFTYDDSAIWHGMGVRAPGFQGLQPSATFAIEIEKSAFGSGEGSYLELGIEPSFSSFAEFDGQFVTLSFPVTLGISLDSYYTTPSNNDAFGYLDVGVVATWPITFVPADYGAWELAAGVHLLYLANGNLEAANNGDDTEIIGTVSLGMGY